MTPDSTQRGLLLVVSGPSAVGKGTVCKALMDMEPNLRVSVSCTTRAARPGEVHGEHYFFRTQEEFQQMIDQGGFIEYAKVFDHCYGTPREAVEEQLSKGHDVLLEIDVQGALQVMEKMPEGIYIFVLPPTMAALRERIDRRGTESDEIKQKRLDKAAGEIGFVARYQYCVINEKVIPAAVEIRAILTAEKRRIERNERFIHTLLTQTKEAQ